MTRSLADPYTLVALRAARDSINLAIKDANLGHGCRYNTFIAIATLREMLDSEKEGNPGENR